MSRISDAASTLGIAIALTVVPDCRHAVRVALDIQHAEMNLRAVVPAADIPAVMAQVERREADLVPVVFAREERSADGSVEVRREVYQESRGRLRALREVYQDYATGEWKP